MTTNIPRGVRDDEQSVLTENIGRSTGLADKQQPSLAERRKQSPCYKNLGTRKAPMSKY
ncbi:hypothetical protein CONPUDRAFT_85589 [Coniophora puteana RWD-64-598 SS2]|uniref:Uncharacterized protein n=1 Tax=Coniophora puteana (strain RWD-64-598) TaxID=741705 RepID=A0A5M3M5X2_CONPW|nr:uncharacterized protein CONPUDRAFT_85589 [Coniophora puteana RWD-64-598 SS2]EIW74778.1 hypothetical protein CONPUDRAFT_85589 [Coniophora puteana RWD-64-598 SS2]